MIIFVTTLFLILAYLLIRLFIKLYFRVQANRYSQKSNFLIKYAFFLLYLAFCFVNPSISDSIINWGIDLLNNNYEFSLTHIRSESPLISLMFYVIFCLTICYGLYLSYNKREKKLLRESFIYNNQKIKQIKEIKFPKNEFQESPHLRIRLKKYFELKYQKYDLTLKGSIKDQILYGEYKDGYRIFYLFISYEDRGIEEVITPDYCKTNKVFLEDFAKNIFPKKGFENELVDYYYIISNGKFSNHTTVENYFIKTEDDILNELIDFRGYLKNVIKGYNQDKLFSAIAADKDKKTLAETFITPPFSVNEDEESSDSLGHYMNNWLSNSSDSKHLVLLGDYGMGKTSFLRHYTKELATDILINNNLVRYPVLISLTNSSPRHGGIDEKIKVFVADNLGVDYALFEILIHKGKILFLLDGFDEMGFVGTHDDRFKQINEIWQLAHENNKLIISGRPSYFPSKYELYKTLNIVERKDQIIQTNPYCESINLNLLHESQIQEHIEKYYPGKGLYYFNWITQFPSILELCKRPSMMHIIREMMPNLHRKGNVNIDTHGAAIEQYIDYWINRQQSKNIQSAFDNHIKKREFVKKFFSELAVELFLGKQYHLSPEYVLDKLEIHIKKSNIKKFEADYQKEGFENEILTCYFIEIEDGYYRFVHKSFFEYFLAKDILEKISKSKFSSPILFEVWSNSIVNFIYDEIPEKLKKDDLVPALLLLTHKKWLGNIKSKIFKFFLQYSENIVSSILFITFIISIVFYFKYLDYSLVWKFVLLIPFIIIFLTVVVFIYGSIYNLLKSNKKIQFITKAFKIAFIKEQFDKKKNLNIVLDLLKIKTLPHIPIEDIDIEYRSFNSCSFYRLKNVKFTSCMFSTPIISNCHLNSVQFIKTSFSPIIFNNCRFTNVNFLECKFNNNVKEKKIILPSSKGKESIIDFKNCKLDNITILNLKQLIKSKNLKLGVDIIGSKNFLIQME